MTNAEFEITTNSTLEEYLKFLNLDKSRTTLCANVIPTLVQSIEKIGSALRSSSQISQVGSANAFGDDQLNVDVIAEDIVRAAISQCPSVSTASSEEDPVERPVKHVLDHSGPGKETYTIAFDPLDGSSIIAPNWTVGTIVGIWDGPSALEQHPAKQVAAILGVYGPRTTAVIAVRVPGWEEQCFEVSLHNGTTKIVRPSIKFDSAPFKTRYFAPANLRAAGEDEKYMQLISDFVVKRYTLRYAGGLVPDIVHALVKGHGVYISPVTGKSKPKLRSLFELAPIALIVECAGGSAIDERGRRILDEKITNVDDRGGLICGTTEEVIFVKQRLGLA